MCGRFVSATPPDQLAAHFGVDRVAASIHEPSYNLAPTDPVPTVVERRGERILGAMRWGLVPFWAKDARIGNRMINARAESVATKPAFRSALQRHRCLVVADGFYEWTRLAGHRTKTPFYIRRRDGAPMAFAGLWDRWNDPDGTELVTCTIITGAPNEAVAQIHDRMPVMLARHQWDRWLDPDERDIAAAESLLVPGQADELVLHAVSTAVNNSRSEGAELIAAVTPACGDAEADG